MTDFTNAIEDKVGSRLEGLEVEFADPTELRVYNGVKLIDLPARWAQNSLIREPEPAPVLVAQVPIGEGEWLYLAGLLREPYYLSESRYLSADQLLFVLIMLAILLVVPPLLLWGFIANWEKKNIFASMSNAFYLTIVIVNGIYSSLFAPIKDDLFFIGTILIVKLPQPVSIVILKISFCNNNFF